MPEFLDYDPFTGLRYSTEFDEANNRMTLITEQDVEPLLDMNKRLANEGACDSGVKGEFFWWATVPNIVKLQLRQRGLNFYSSDPAEQKKIRQIIHQEYPYCRTSYLKHI